MVSTKAQADNLLRKRQQSTVKGIENVKELVKEKEKLKEIEEPVNRSFVSFMYLVILFWEAGAALIAILLYGVFFLYINFG